MRGGEKEEGLRQEEGCLVHHSRGNELVQMQGSSSSGESEGDEGGFH